MKLRRKAEVPVRPVDEAVLRESVALQAELSRMVRRLETFTDLLLLQTANRGNSAPPA